MNIASATEYQGPQQSESDLLPGKLSTDATCGRPYGGWCSHIPEPCRSLETCARIKRGLGSSPGWHASVANASSVPMASSHAQWQAPNIESAIPVR
eukprot:365900-Chlamydomonas_euryale.AAC.17